MNQIITFLFAILILLFAIYPISQIFKDEADLHQTNKIKEKIDDSYLVIERYCKDPFLTNKFFFDYVQPYEVYISDSKFCVRDSSDFIYCKRVSCELLDKVLITNNSFEKTYKCVISNNRKLNITCS
jgi:hypothetical protein